MLNFFKLTSLANITTTNPIYSQSVIIFTIIDIIATFLVGMTTLLAPNISVQVFKKEPTMVILFIILMLMIILSFRPLRIRPTYNLFRIIFNFFVTLVILYTTYTAIRNNLIRLRLDTNNIIDSIMTFAWNHPIITTGFGLATIGGITWFFFYRTRNLVYATQALVGSNFIENLLTPTDQMPHPNGVARPQTRFSSFVLLGAQAGGALFLIKIIISGLRH